MRMLNYHHLYYFWTVAKRGSITEACDELELAQPTISAQLKSLEVSLGEKLFLKKGRYLSLTETGEIAFRYAEQIFTLGNELIELMEGKNVGKAELLRIGICDVLPKVLVHRLTEPLFTLSPQPRVQFFEGSAEKLLSELAIHQLDLVLSDCPIPPSVRARAYNHELGSSPITFVANESIVKKHAKEFPQCLGKIDLLLPSPSALIRQDLNIWFERNHIIPQVASEFQDSALMKLFGKQGIGAFPIPTAIEEEVCKEMEVSVLGRIPELSEQYYLISLERKIKHRGVAAICKKAQNVIFK